jgi:hypothetical protein
VNIDRAAALGALPQERKEQRIRSHQFFFFTSSESCPVLGTNLVSFSSGKETMLHSLKTEGASRQEHFFGVKQKYKVLSSRSTNLSLMFRASRSFRPHAGVLRHSQSGYSPSLPATRQELYSWENLCQNQECSTPDGNF